MANSFKFGAFGSGSFGSGTFSGQKKEPENKSTGTGASRSPSVVFDDLSQEEKDVYKPLYQQKMRENPDDPNGAMLFAEDGLFTWQNNQKYFDPKGNLVNGKLNQQAAGRTPSIIYDNIQDKNDKQAYYLGYRDFLRKNPGDLLGAQIAGEDEIRRNHLTEDQQLAESMLGDLSRGNNAPLYLKDQNVIGDLLTMNGAGKDQVGKALPQYDFGIFKPKNQGPTDAAYAAAMLDRQEREQRDRDDAATGAGSRVQQIVAEKELEDLKKNRWLETLGDSQLAQEAESALNLLQENNKSGNIYQRDVLDGVWDTINSVRQKIKDNSEERYTVYQNKELIDEAEKTAKERFENGTINKGEYDHAMNMISAARNEKKLNQYWYNDINGVIEKFTGQTLPGEQPAETGPAYTFGAVDTNLYRSNMEAAQKKIRDEIAGGAMQPEELESAEADLAALTAYMDGTDTSAEAKGNASAITEAWSKDAVEKRNPVETFLADIPELIRESTLNNMYSIINALAGNTDAEKLNTPTLDKYTQAGRDAYNKVNDAMWGGVDAVTNAAYNFIKGVGEGLQSAVVGANALAKLFGFDAVNNALLGENAVDTTKSREYLTNQIQKGIVEPADKEAVRFKENLQPKITTVLSAFGMDKDTAQSAADIAMTYMGQASEMVGRMVPSLVASWAAGGSGAGEAANIIGRLMNSWKTPGFLSLWLTSTGEAYQNSIDKYGENVTYGNALASLIEGFFDATIENYETKWGFSNGVQAIAGGRRFPRFGEMVGGIASETSEELKQLLSGDVWENFGNILSGQPLAHPLDGDTEESLFYVAKYLDTAKDTVFTTLGMNSIIGAGNVAANMYQNAVQAVVDGNATPEQMEQAQQVAMMAAVAQEDQVKDATVTTPDAEEQHDMFEAGLAGGDQGAHQDVDGRAQAEVEIRNQQGTDNNRVDTDTDVRAAEQRMREAQAAEVQAIIASNSQTAQAEERARLEQEARDAIERRKLAEAEYQRAQAAAGAAVSNQNEQVNLRTQEEEQARTAQEEAAKYEMRLRKAQENLARAEEAARQQGMQAKDRKEAEKRAGIARRQLRRAQEAYNNAMKAVEDQNRQADARKEAEEAAWNSIDERNRALQAQYDQTNQNAAGVIADQNQQAADRAQLEQDARIAEMRMQEARAAEVQAIIASNSQSEQAEERQRLAQEAQDAIARRKAAEEEYQRARAAADAAVQGQNAQADERNAREDEANRNREDLDDITRRISEAGTQDNIQLTPEQVQEIINGYQESEETEGYEGEEEQEESGEGTAEGRPEAEGQTSATQETREEEAGGNAGNQGADEEDRRGEGAAEGKPEAQGQTSAEKEVQEEAGGNEGNQGTDVQDETRRGEGTASSEKETEGQASTAQETREEGENAGSEGDPSQAQDAAAESGLTREGSEHGEGSAQGEQETGGEISEQRVNQEETGENAGNVGAAEATDEETSTAGSGEAQGRQEAAGETSAEQAVQQQEEAGETAGNKGQNAEETAENTEGYGEAAGRTQEEAKNAETVSKSNGWSFLSDDRQQAAPGVNVRSWSGSGVSETQKAQLQRVDWMAKKHNVIAIVDSTVDGGIANGKYSPRDQQGRLVVHIAQDAENPLDTVFSHELYHLVAANNPKAAQQIERAVADFMRRRGMDIENEVEKLRTHYREASEKTGGKIRVPGDAVLREEVVANSIYDAIGDENTIRALAAQDRGLVQKIHDWISKVMKDIHEMLNQYTDKTPAAKALQETEGAMDKLRKMIEDALEEIGRLEQVKKAGKSLGSNSRMTAEFAQGLDEATSFSEANKAAHTLAESILREAGLEATPKNVNDLIGTAQMAASGMMISEAAQGTELAGAIKNSPEMNRAVMALGRYANSLAEQGSEADYMGLYGIGEENTEENTKDENVRYSPKPYSQHEKDNWADSKRIIIYNNNQQLVDFVNESLNDNTFNKKLYFGKVNDALARDIYNDHGIDIKDYNIALYGENVRKIIHEHGQAKESLSGQKVIGTSDFLDAVITVEFPDTVELSNTDYMGKPVLVFKKNINGKVNAVYVVSNKHHELFLQTLYKNVKKENLSTTPSATPNGGFSQTSVTPSGTVPNNSISQQNYPAKYSLKLFDQHEEPNDKLPATMEDIYKRQSEINQEMREVDKKIWAFRNSKEVDNLQYDLMHSKKEEKEELHSKWKELEKKYEIVEAMDKQKQLKAEKEELNKQEDTMRYNQLVDQIQKSGKTRGEFFRDRAIKEFGYTSYFYDAGYILPNGKMLNFSGEKGKHFGTRGQDHRAISTIYDGTLEGTEALNAFVRDGNVRIMDEAPGIDISLGAELTEAQKKIISQHVTKRGRDGYNVDLTGPDGHVEKSLEYDEGVKPGTVLADIEDALKNGVSKPRSLVSEFHTMYSLKSTAADQEYQKAVDSGNVEEQQRLVDQAAKDAGFSTEHAYHGTEEFGFTQFDMPRSQGMIFVAYNEDISKTYGHGLEKKQIEKNYRFSRSYLEKANKKQLESVVHDYYKNLMSKDTDVKVYTTQEEYKNALKNRVAEAKQYMTKEEADRFGPLMDKIIDNFKTMNSQALYKLQQDIDKAFNDILERQLNENKLDDRQKTNDLLWGILKRGGLERLNSEGDIIRVSLYGDTYSTKKQIMNLILNDSWGGIYDMYTKPGKQLVVDAKGENWSTIHPEWDQSGRGWKTREIADYAKRNGYDSVRINNVYDHGGYWGDREKGYGDIGIFFNEEDVRSADPVTYDDDGIPIMPSERFSDNKDFRYSIKDDQPGSDERVADEKRLNEAAMDTLGGDMQAWDLLSAMRDIKRRLTQDADGKDVAEKGYWKGDVKKIVQALEEDTGSSGRTKEITKLVTEFFQDLDNFDGSNAAFFDYALREAQALVTDLYRGEHRAYNAAMAEEYENGKQALKEYFRGGYWYIDPAMKEYVDKYLGGWREFRKVMNANGIKVTTVEGQKKNGRSYDLESVWRPADPQTGRSDSNGLYELLGGEDTDTVGDILQKAYDAVTQETETGDEQLTMEEYDLTGKIGLSLVADYLQAGAKVITTHSVEKIDDQRHRETVEALDQAKAETEAQRDEIQRKNDQIEELNGEIEKLRTAMSKEISRAYELGQELKALKENGADAAQLAQVKEELRLATAERQKAQNAKEKAEAKLGTLKEEMKDLKAQLRKAERAQERAMSKLEDAGARRAETMAAYREKIRTKYRTEYKEKIAAAKARQEKTKVHRKLVNSIRKTGATLRSYLAHPNASNGFIPQENARAAAELIEALMVNDGRKSAAQASRRLMDSIRDAKESPNYFVSTMYDDELNKAMQDVARMLEDKRSLQNLSDGDLALVEKTLKAIVHQIKNAGQTIGRKRNMELAAESADGVLVMNRNKLKMEGLGRLIRKFGMTQLNAQRFFDIWGHHADNAITRMGEELSEGQRKKNMLTMKMTKVFEGLTQGENEKKFDKFTGKNATWYDTGIEILKSTGDGSGKTWKMNGAMRAFFALSFQTLDNRNGMVYETQNGHPIYQLTIPDEELMKKGKEKEAYARADRIFFTTEQAEHIIDELTDYEKEWMTAWRNMEKLSKEAINETSLLLNGFRKANVNDYVPIFRDPRFIGKEFETVLIDSRLTSLGFLNERVDAHNPMMLMDLTNVINRQVRDVSDYYGFAIPTRNATKIYNGNLGGTSFKEVLNKTQGPEVAKYFEKLMADLQGGSRVESSFLDRLRGNVAGATLAGNPSVIIKQAASYPAAASVLGWGPLMKGLKYFNPASLRKIDVNEIDKYTSALWERRSRSLSDLEANANRNTAMSKFLHKMTNGIQGMDIATTKVIWKAAEYYVDEHSPNLQRGTEAYNNAVARIYEQALEGTQPEYGTMQRPQILRSTNQLVKSLTMYKTQSLQNFGILVDAATNLSDKAKADKAKSTPETQEALRQAKRQMATALSSQITSAVILGVMTAVGKALLHKLGGYRDDKGDLTVESVGGQILKDSASSVAGMVAGGSELFDMINGLIEGQSPFDIEAAGVSTINDLYQNTYAFLDAMKVLGDSDLSDAQKMSQMWPKLRKLGMSIALLKGIPANNFMNLLDGIAANAADFATGKAGTFASQSPLQIAGTALIGSAQGRETSNKAVAGYIAQAMMEGRQAEAVRLYNEQLRQGETADALNTAIATWQKQNIPQIREAAEAIDSGDLVGYNQKINQLVEMGLSMTNAVKYVEAVRKKVEGRKEEVGGNNTPMTYEDIVSGMTKATATSEENSYTNGMMNSLLEDGNIDAAKAIRDDMLKNGKKSSAINSSLTSHWKPLLQAAYAEGDMAEVRRITNMLVSMGMKRTTVQGWATSGSSSSSSSSSKKSGFGSGSFGSGSFGSSKTSSKYSSKKSTKKSGFGSGSFGSGTFGK